MIRTRKESCRGTSPFYYYNEIISVENGEKFRVVFDEAAILMLNIGVTKLGPFNISPGDFIESTHPPNTYGHPLIYVQSDWGVRLDSLPDEELNYRKALRLVMKEEEEEGLSS